MRKVYIDARQIYIMQDIPYSTTQILYHNKLENIHDIESYYTFLKLAWIDHSATMVAMLTCGVLMGILTSKYLYIYLKKHDIIKVVN